MLQLISWQQVNNTIMYKKSALERENLSEVKMRRFVEQYQNNVLYPRAIVTGLKSIWSSIADFEIVIKEAYRMTGIYICS